MEMPCDGTGVRTLPGADVTQSFVRFLIHSP